MRKSIPVFIFGILILLVSSEVNATLTAPEITFPRKNSIISVTQPTFEWRSVSGATRYQIQVATGINFSSPIVDTVTSSASLACPVALETGGYYLRVRAGNPRNWGDWSENNWGFSVEPTSSNRVSLYRPENGETLSYITPDFGWSEISGASEYQIQISTVEDFSSTLTDENVRYGRSNAAGVDLQNHVIYYWRVRAHLADGWTEWSFVRNFSWRENLLILRPNPRAIVNEARPNFSWSNFSSATQYQIQLSRNSEFSSNGIDSIVTEPNLTAPFNLVNGNYYVRVRAGYGDVWDPWCETVNFTITIYATPAAVILGSPDNDAVINSRTPDFNWRITSAATEYVLEVSASSDFSALEISRTLSGTYYRTTADEQLNEGRHFWRVKAKNPTCEGPYSEVRSFNINVGGIPAAVALDAPSEGAEILILRPRFTWQQLDDADSYNIQVSRDSNFSNLVFEDNIVTGQISSPEDLIKGGSYYWRVRAQNRSGFGPWSGVRTFWVTLDAHEAPAIPALIHPNDNAVVNSPRPVFSWSCFSMRDEENPFLYYTIEVATQNNFCHSSIVYSARPMGGEAVPDRDLSEGVPYYWRVNRSMHDGTGDWSQTRIFRIQYELPPAPEGGQPNGEIRVGNRRPEFSWRISTGYGISSSQIQFSLRQDFSDIAREENVANLPDPLTVTFIPSGDLPYGNLYWRVRAQNNLGFSPWSQVWTVYLPHVEPTRVVLLSPANRSQVAALRPVFEWEPPNSCSDYGIQISRRRDFSDLVADETFAAARGASFTPTADLQDSAIYFWRVRQGMMGVYDWAEWSETWDFRVNTQASAVILDYPLDNSALNVNRPEFRWQAVRDAHHYTLEVSDRENFSNTVIRLFPNTNSIYANRDLSDGLYFWRVLANFPDGFTTNLSEVRRFRVDRFQPSIRIITPAERVFVSDPLPAKVKVTARVRDSGAAPSGIRKVVFFVDDVEAAEKTRPDAGMDTYETMIDLNKGAHIYNITVQAFDMAGNSQETSFTLELKRGQSKTRLAEPAVTGRRPSNFRVNTHARAAKEFARGGIKLLGGMSMANMKVFGEIPPEATKKSKMGFSGGLGFESGGTIGFETDLLFTPGGTILDATVNGQTAKITISGYGIAVPLLLKVRFMPGTTPYVLAGGEIGYILSQKVLIEYNGQTQERDVKDDINRLYYGLVFGGGLELQTGGMNLLFEARYNLGLSNQVKEPAPGVYAKATAFTIVLGVKF